MTGAEIPIAMAVAPELIGGAAAAGTAAGLGAAGTAAGLGAGTAAGLGGGTAALFGAGAGAGALAPSTVGLLGGGAAASMAPAAAPAALGMGGGTASLFGAAGAGASPLATELATTPGIVKPPGFNWTNAADALMKGASQAGGQQQQRPVQHQQPNSMGAGQQLQSNQEILQRLKMQQMMGPRSNFASLLGGY